MNDILAFKNGELELEVAVSKDRENVWLSQRQMAKLFNIDRTRITRHINNIYKDSELEEKKHMCGKRTYWQFRCPNIFKYNLQTKCKKLLLF